MSALRKWMRVTRLEAAALIAVSPARHARIAAHTGCPSVAQEGKMLARDHKTAFRFFPNHQPQSLVGARRRVLWLRISGDPGVTNRGRSFHILSVSLKEHRDVSRCPCNRWRTDGSCESVCDRREKTPVLGDDDPPAHAVVRAGGALGVRRMHPWVLCLWKLPVMRLPLVRTRKIGRRLEGGTTCA
jgi:hypothetical protein